MKRPETNSSETERLLAAERPIPSASAELKSRALSRARAAFVSPGTVAPPLARLQRTWAVALAAAVAAAAISFGALRALGPSAPAPARTIPSGEPARPHVTASNTTEAKSETAPMQNPEPAPERGVHDSAPRRAPAADSHNVELAILQRARAAVAGGRFATALEAVAEHQRRFPNGLLQEEREALRVKALAGLGKSDDARTAAQRFREKFPNSVLAPRLDAGTPRAP
jgi:TolA-binding protein